MPMHNHSSNNIYKCGNEPARSLWHTEIISLNFLFDLIPKYYKSLNPRAHAAAVHFHIQTFEFNQNLVQHSQEKSAISQSFLLQYSNSLNALYALCLKLQAFNQF